MKGLSLFSGIGGLDIAAEWAGITPLAFCEIEPYPISILEKRYPGIPIYNDIRQLKGSDFNDRIDVIHGGFPCQDLSQAGKRAGLEGERSGLWFEMLRIISEVRPRYVLAENVRGAVNLALDTVYANLVDEGYKVYPYVIPASAVGAPHQRERLFVLGVREDVHRRYTEAMANPGCALRQGGEFCGADGVETENRDADKPERPSSTLWPTLTGTERSGINPKTDSGAGLSKTVKFWPTPRAQEPGRTTEGYGRGLQELVEGKEQHKLWPTPSVHGNYNRRGLSENSGDGLATAVKMWPTAQARDWKGSSGRSLKGKEIDLPTAIKTASIKTSGRLNPDWVEQLMNFPEGWTDLDVDEPKPWAGWPALMGESLWRTPQSQESGIKVERLEGEPGHRLYDKDTGRLAQYGVSQQVELVKENQYPYEFPRTTTGCKNRAKRLKCLGNAVVPLQAYPFFRAVRELDVIYSSCC